MVLKLTDVSDSLDDFNDHVFKYKPLYAAVSPRLYSVDRIYFLLTLYYAYKVNIALRLLQAGPLTDTMLLQTTLLVFLL